MFIPDVMKFPPGMPEASCSIKEDGREVTMTLDDRSLHPGSSSL